MTLVRTRRSITVSRASAPPVALVLALDDAVSDDFFFADVHLRLFLRCQSRAHAHHLVVLQRALGLSPAQPQPIELDDEIFGFDPQFFG